MRGNEICLNSRLSIKEGRSIITISICHEFELIFSGCFMEAESAIIFTLMGKLMAYEECRFIFQRKNLTFHTPTSYLS